MLHTRLGKPAFDEPVGESWEVWDGNAVEAGPWRGYTLHDLVVKFPREVLGEVPMRRSRDTFPLLTKFIDAQEPLSVQVHPNDQQAQELEGQANGKTEAWYILGAQGEAWIVYGLTNPVDSDELRERLSTGTADDLLKKVSVEPGQTVFVPAGTIHAIGPGVLLHEVQQTSDVTYRLYDWNRQAHGSKRELHVDKGLQVSTLEPGRAPFVHSLQWSAGAVEVSLILASEYFAVKRLRLAGELRLDTAYRSFHIITVLSGSARLKTAAAAAGSLQLGQSIVLPACLGQYVLGSDEAEVLVEYIPQIRTDLVPELQGHGIGKAEIERFLSQFTSAV